MFNLTMASMYNKNIGTKRPNNTSFGGKKQNTLIKELNSYLEKQKLTLECNFEPENKEYSIPEYFYTILLKNGKNVNVQGAPMNLFGYGITAKKAILNLIEKIKGYKLKTQTEEIPAFRPGNCEEKQHNRRMHFEPLEIQG